MNLEATVSLISEILAVWFALSFVLVALFAFSGFRLQRRALGKQLAATRAGGQSDRGQRAALALTA